MSPETWVFYARFEHRVSLEQANGVGKVAGCRGSSMQAIAQDFIDEKDDLFMDWHC